MSELVADTDVVSFMFKNSPTGRLYGPMFAAHERVISFMTVAELERWAIQYNWGEPRRRRLAVFLEPFIVVPSSTDLCRKWAEAMVAAQAAGRRIESSDAWIAATALLQGAPLVTHNRSDYLGVPGLTLISHAP